MAARAAAVPREAARALLQCRARRRSCYCSAARGGRARCRRTAALQCEAMGALPKWCAAALRGAAGAMSRRCLQERCLQELLRTAAFSEIIGMAGNCEAKRFYTS